MGQLQVLKCNNLSNQSDIFATEQSGDQILDAGTSFNQKLQNETVCSQLKTTPRWLYHTMK